MEFSWGVAHDVSNFLQIIMGFSEMLQMQHKNDPELLDSLAEILTACKRGTVFVDKLLVLSQRKILKVEALDFGAFLQGLAPSLREALGERIQLQVRCAATPLPGRCDAAIVAEMLRDLCGYVRDGLPQGGAVTLAAQRADGHLKVSLEDSASGCEPALLERAFEPFFMRRRLGRGKGLELPLARALMEQHRGFLRLQTVPGGGTTIELYFPQERTSQ